MEKMIINMSNESLNKLLSENFSKSSQYMTEQSLMEKGSSLLFLSYMNRRNFKFFEKEEKKKESHPLCNIRECNKNKLCLSKVACLLSIPFGLVTTLGKDKTSRKLVSLSTELTPTSSSISTIGRGLIGVCVTAGVYFLGRLLYSGLTTTYKYIKCLAHTHSEHLSIDNSLYSDINSLHSLLKSRTVVEFSKYPNYFCSLMLDQLLLKPRILIQQLLIFNMKFLNEVLFINLTILLKELNKESLVNIFRNFLSEHFDNHLLFRMRRLLSSNSFIFGSKSILLLYKFFKGEIPAQDFIESFAKFTLKLYSKIIIPDLMNKITESLNRELGEIMKKSINENFKDISEMSIEKKFKFELEYLKQKFQKLMINKIIENPIDKISNELGDRIELIGEDKTEIIDEVNKNFENLLNVI